MFDFSSGEVLDVVSPWHTCCSVHVNNTSVVNLFLGTLLFDVPWPLSLSRYLFVKDSRLLLPGDSRLD